MVNDNIQRRAQRWNLSYTLRSHINDAVYAKQNSKCPLRILRSYRWRESVSVLFMFYSCYGIRSKLALGMFVSASAVFGVDDLELVRQRVCSIASRRGVENPYTTRDNVTRPRRSDPRLVQRWVSSDRSDEHLHYTQSTRQYNESWYETNGKLQ